MKTRTTIRHDWLRVVAIDGNRQLSLTVGRNGETASGRGITEPLLRTAINGFARAMKRATNYGNAIADLAKIAEACKTLEEYASKIG